MIRSIQIRHTNLHTLGTYISTTCTPLPQPCASATIYRACVVDSLGLGITCVLYHSTMCSRHPDLVSFAFYAIPIFHIIIGRIFNLLVYTRAVQGIIKFCAAGPCASQDLARIIPMKLSTTITPRWEGVVT